MPANEKKYLEKDEKLDLVALAQAGDNNAMNTIVLDHQNLVYKLAHKANRRSGLDVDDLAQEGNLALIYAVQSFNPEENDNFSGWAYKIIELLLKTYVSKNRSPVKTSARLKASSVDVLQTREYLRAKLTREATLAEVAAFLEITQERIQQALSATDYVNSLDQSINEDGSSTLKDVLPDDSASMPDELKDYWYDKLKEAKGCLDDREQIIVETLISKENGDVKKLQAELDLSKTSINNIYRVAMLKLKKYFKAGQFEEVRRADEPFEIVPKPQTRSEQIKEKGNLYSHVCNHYPMRMNVELFIQNLDRILEQISDEDFERIKSSYGQKNLQLKSGTIKKMREIYYEIYHASAFLRNKPTSPKVSEAPL